MENASKALIIAGAILISILLISVGVMVMNSTDQVTGGMEEEMTRTTIEQFNSKFTQYAGPQKGSTVKSLMNTMTTSNAASTAHQVTVTATIDGKKLTKASDITAAVKPTTSYTITISTGTDGYVNKITIK